ncbi:MAG: ATP-binding cassette domain-containing protein [Clostridia bacterium]|nr:ATP-binding cassette domain-containing protein [Clostridia bacterium]
MNDTPSLLSVKGLKKYFPVSGGLLKKRRYLRANENIDLEIKAGETFSVVGESGSGKSTLGKTLLGLYKPTAGQVIYRTDEKEIDLTKLKKEEMRRLRSDLQIVFQDPYSSLNPKMTVGQIIEEGVATHGYYKKGSRQMREYVQEILQKCGLQKETLHRYPHQFSGGQRQRVGIARALAVKPKFVVCDECVSALDASVQSQILNLLSELKEKENLTYLFISHDLSVVRHVSDSLAVMYLGNIVERGEAKRVFSEPRHPYTLALISAAPKIGERQEKEGIILRGNIPSPVSPPSGCKFHTRCFMAQEICKRVPAPLVEVEKGHFVSCHFAEKTAEEKREIAWKYGENRK